MGSSGSSGLFAMLSYAEPATAAITFEVSSFGFCVLPSSCMLCPYVSTTSRSTRFALEGFGPETCGDEPGALPCEIQLTRASPVMRNGFSGESVVS